MGHDMAELDVDFRLGAPKPAEEFRKTAKLFVDRVVDEGRTPEMWPILRMLFAPGWPIVQDEKKNRCPFCRSQNYIDNPDLNRRYGKYCQNCQQPFMLGPVQIRTPVTPDNDNRYGDAANGQ